jgi:hypothetical protein
MKKQSSMQKTLVIILLLLALSSCVNNTPTPTPIATAVVVQISTEMPDPTIPVEIETPEEINNVFIYQRNAEKFNINSVSLSEIESSANEFGFETISSEEVPDPGSSYSIILLFDPDQETISEFQNYVKDRIIIVSNENPALQDTSTTFIRASKAEEIFIAGYLSALITNDWRVGGLLPDTNYQNTGADIIFENGVVYLCGRCTPTFGPIVNFPVTAKLSQPEDTEATIQAIGEISSNRLNTLYVPSEYLFDDLVILLNQNEVTIISDSILEPNQSDWVDYAIITNLKDLIINSIANYEPDNKESETISVKYSIYSKTNDLSEGRVNFLQDMINNLESGLISPYQITSE